MKFNLGLLGMILVVLASMGLTTTSLAKQKSAPLANDQVAVITVDVKFMGRLQDDMKRINKLELRREKYFRKHRGETRRHGVPRLAKSRYAKAEFAGERLIPVLEEYSFETLVRRAVVRDIHEMNLDVVPARVAVTLQQMRIADYSIAHYRSHSTVMTGTVEVFDAAGKRSGAVKLTWEMVPLFTTDQGYSGREYVFLRESAYVRVAPLTLGFLEKALEQIYSGKDAPGPVFIWPPKGGYS